MISVCMATHNGERYIGEQVRSILTQLGPEDEVVVSDDSSTDRTTDIIHSFDDQRIRLFENNTFRSPIFNFEFALTQARGEVIVLSDQDDIWLGNKLDVVREKFDSPPHKYFLIVMDGEIVDGDGVPFDSIFNNLKAGSGFWKNIYNNRYLGCSMAFSRELLQAALPFPIRIPMHDMWLGQLCERIGRTEFVPVKTMKYRRHKDTVTRLGIEFRPLLQIRRRCFLAYYLLTRSLHVAMRKQLQYQ